MGAVPRRLSEPEPEAQPLHRHILSGKPVAHLRKLALGETACVIVSRMFHKRLGHR